VSQFTSPTDDEWSLWKIWGDFELHHGNIDNFKDLLRLKRSVQARFSMLPPDTQKIQDQVLQEQTETTQEA